mmetsp:Transcript_17486/g.40752  ORF Transcript_17486/g.40752 Transcript_17486/m.40752 type:complete len:413 (-) Transcript_17486:224-1462(-)
MGQAALAQCECTQQTQCQEWIGSACGSRSVAKESTTEQPQDDAVKGSKVMDEIDLTKAPPLPIASVKDAEDLEEAMKLKVKSFTVELHSATLVRSFAKFGSMHVYAAISTNDKEVMKTITCKGKNPNWEEKHVFDEVPGTLDIALWDKNEFHKHVLCGRVAIPCSSDMVFDRQDFALYKQGSPTGNICLSIRAEFEKDADRLVGKTRSVGGEFDNMMSAMDPSRRKSQRTKTVIALSNLIVHESENEEEEELSPPVSPPQLDRMTSVPSQAFQPHALVGRWECVATQGLDEFMVKSGVGTFQRKIAKAAKWPAWEFAANGDVLNFHNHSAIGILKEEIKVGSEYKWTDGKNNEWTCKASWTRTPSGGKLHIARQGALGNYEELRVVDDDKLEFTLTNPQYQASWGRSFVRKA